MNHLSILQDDGTPTRGSAVDSFLDLIHPELLADCQEIRLVTSIPLTSECITLESRSEKDFERIETKDQFDAWDAHTRIRLLSGISIKDYKSQCLSGNCRFTDKERIWNFNVQILQSEFTSETRLKLLKVNHSDEAIDFAAAHLLLRSTMGKNEIFTTASLEGGVLRGKEVGLPEMAQQFCRSAGSPPSPDLSATARRAKEEGLFIMRLSASKAVVKK